MKSCAPFISVVIPVFNRSWKLHRALDSLQNQIFKDFEVIVCDDGSTEDISALIKGFEGALNICLLKIPNWGGPAKPRNEGLKLATSEWVAFLDSDDWWDTNRLDVVAGYLNNEVDILYHPMRVIRGDGIKEIREKRQALGDAISGDPYRHMMLMGNPLPTSATIVRKSLLLLHQGMSEERGLISVEDFDCWLRLAKAGARFHFLNQCLGSYWVGSDAISAISSRQLEVQKLLYQRNAPEENLNFKKRALARQNYVLGSIYLKLDKPKLAFDYLRIAGALETLELRIKRWALIILALVKMTRAKISSSNYRGG